jgi:hypothetical protein
MTGQELLELYEAGYRTIRSNLEAISHQESMRPASEAGGNSLNWVVGHTVQTRNVVLRLAGAEPIWDDGLMLLYSSQEDVIFDPARALPLERLEADLDETQVRIRAVLPGIAPERLAAPAFFGTVGFTLAFLVFHEGYHSGQLGILRRLLGKPGKIKPPKIARV